MTTKQQVNLDTYHKRPRLLAEPMEVALGPGGALHPVLATVVDKPQLRLDIRDRRFNVYYCGGNLMLVDGRPWPWELHFDKKYFANGTLLQSTLPTQFSSIDDAHAWVKAFPELIAAMENWWARHPKGERKDCQDIAAANSGRVGFPPADYLVLDLEYEWALRRFDIVAAKRRPTEHDNTGWAEPDMVFIEVKSKENACSGNSGLHDHARDYRDIIMARRGRRVQEIKIEYENVIAQKTRLGLLDASLGFKSFSSAVPELLVVFADLDPNKPLVRKALAEVRDRLGKSDYIHFLQLDQSNYVMYANAALPLESLVAEGT